MQMKNVLVFFLREVEKSYEETNKPSADDYVPGNGLILSVKDRMNYDNTTDQQHV